MGACHATSNIKRVQKPKKTSISYNKTSPIPTADNLSWIDTNEVSTQNDLNNNKVFNITPSLISFFGKFYRKQIKALKESETFLFDATQRNLFVEQLAHQNNITQATADVWVHAYIDYMIVMAWLYFAVEEKEMYAPFAIQQTQRLHLSHGLEYNKFCNILTGEKGLIHYSPNKLVSSHQPIDTIEMLYDELKETVMTYVYDNSEIFSEVFNDIFNTSTKTKYQLQEVWENFYETFLKNEYSFLIQKSQGPQILKAITNIHSENHNFPMSYEGVQLLRNAMSLPIEYRGDSSLDIMGLVQEKDKNLARTIDEGKLPLNFARLLSWEQVISIERAREIVVQYKKFILNVLTSQGINELPREEIKQAWFLHMSFTRNYQKFMEEIVKKHLLQETARYQITTLFQRIEANSQKTGTSFVEFVKPIMKRQEELVNHKIQSLYSVEAHL